jgi:hypothetical protein
MNDMKMLAIAAAVGLAVAGAALAHPHPEGSDGEKVKKFVIITDHGEMKGKGHDGAKHVRTLRIDGERLAGCLGGRTLVDETAGDDKNKTKVVICGKDGDTRVDAERLEQALSRINSNEHISAEHKEKISSALREAIEKARSAR